MIQSEFFTTKPEFRYLDKANNAHGNKLKLKYIVMVSETNTWINKKENQ